MLQIFYLLTEVSCYEHLGLADQKGPVTREGAVEIKFREKSSQKRGKNAQYYGPCLLFILYYFFHVAS